MTFSFGQSELERLEIVILGYEREPSGDHFDDNWLVTEISVRAGGFRGKANATILCGELVCFEQQLGPLYEILSGTAEFTTLEEQLYLKLSGDGKGHIDLVGELADQPGIGNRLQFKLQFDQSQLKASIRELQDVIEAYPVRKS